MKRKPATVRSRMLLIILAVLLPLLVLLNGYALFMRSMALQRQQEQGEYELLQHAQQTDEALRNTRAYLNARTDVAAELAVKPGSFSLQYQALQQLRQGMLFLSDVDMLFFYLPGEDRFLCRRSANISYAQLMALNAYVRGQHEALSGGSWQLVEVEGTAYLYYHFSAYGVVMGGFVKAQTTLSGIQDGERGFQYYLSDTRGSVYSAPQRLAQAGVALDLARATPYQSGASGEYHVLRTISQNGSFFYWQVTGQEAFTRQLNWFVLLVQIISLLAFLCIPFFYRKMTQWYIRPLNKLNDALIRFAGPDRNCRIELEDALAEFRVIARSFNGMAEDINTLTIRVYEESLKKQKAELDMLKAKIRPHAYLNMLSTISNLAALHRFDDLQAYISAMSRHIRYLFTSGFNKICLREELLHITNFIKMQNVRFDGGIMLYTEIEEGLQNAPVFPFMLYTFVENSVKHNAACKTITDIFVRAKSETDPDTGKRRLLLAVEDSGSGLPQTVLRQVRSIGPNTASDPEHIGIVNLYKALDIVYAGSAAITIANRAGGGTAVCISLPLEESP